MTKTNAARILDRQGIKYELLVYEVDESDLSAIKDINYCFENITVNRHVS